MLFTFNLIAALATFLGGMVPMAQHYLSRKGMRNIFAFRSGILLAVTFTEILPAALGQYTIMAGWGAMAAFVLFYAAGKFAMVDSCPEYLEECPIHVLTWVAFGALFIHSFLDGFNFGMSFAAGTVASSAIGTALTLHKLADGFTLTSLFRQTGYSKAQSLAGLAAVALATPIGSFFSFVGVAIVPPSIAFLMLGFAGGSFIYVGAADVIPRIHRSEDHGALGYFICGILGIAALQII